MFKPTGLRQRGQSASTPAPSQTAGGLPGETAANTYAQPAIGPQPEIIRQAYPSEVGSHQEAPFGPAGGRRSQEPAHHMDSYGAAPGSPIRSSSVEMTPAQEPFPGRDPYAHDHGRSASGQPFPGSMHRGTPSLQLDVPGTGPGQGIVSQGPPPSQPAYSPARMSSSSRSPERRSGGRPPVVPGAWHPTDTPSRPGDGNTYTRLSSDATAPMAEPMPVATGATSFPPRKSSLTQAMPLPTDLTGVASHSMTSTTSAAGEASPVTRGTRDRSVSSSRQPPTIIRPADIYKRMEEERSRERSLSASARPSMESMGSRPAESELPITSTLDPRRSAESLRQGEEGEMPFRAKTRLDPVTERKSEYGLEGLLASNAQRTEGRFNLTPTGNGTAPNSLALSNPGRDLSTSSDATTPPSLPAVGRLSGFGESLWTAESSGEAPPSTAQPTGPASIPAPSAADTTPNPSTIDSTRDPAATTLEHQPSMGFRSVVHQAFDQQSPSPATDSLQSTPMADPRRSNTTSTAGISPIISRAPSGHAGPVSAIAEERPFTDMDPSQPRSSSPGTLTHPPTSSSAEPAPPTIRLGHRRDLSTPSPNNSPARSPGVEANKPLREPDAAELATTTPVDPPQQDVHLEDLGRTVPGPTEGQYETGMGAGPPQQRSFSQDNREQQATEPRQESAVMPTEQSLPPTPSEMNQSSDDRPQPPRPKAGFSFLRSKVKDLAGRFDNPIQPKPLRGDKGNRSPEEQSPSARPDAPPRDASFRPALPGGWVSYAPSTGKGTPPPTTDQSSSPQGPHPAVKLDTPSMGHAGRTPATGAAEHSPFVSSPAAGQQATSANEVDERPMVVRETSAVGHATPSDAPSEPQREPDAKIKRISGPPSIPPTPPPKDTPATESSPGSPSNYFTTPLAPRRPPSDRGPASTRITPELDLPPVLPPLSTDNSPHDQESDKLRKEIVKSLNLPELSAMSAHPAQWEHYQPEPSQSLGVPHAGESTRDSTVLPREYDSYWASMRDEQEASPQAGRSSQAVTESVEPEKKRPESPMPSAGASNRDTTDVPHSDYFPRPLSTAAPKQQSAADPPASASPPVDSSTESPNLSVTAHSDTPVSPYVPTPDTGSHHPSHELQGPRPLGTIEMEPRPDSVSPATSQEMPSSHQQHPSDSTITAPAPEVVTTVSGSSATDDFTTRPLSASEIQAILEREGQQVGPPKPATPEAAPLQELPSHISNQQADSPDVKGRHSPAPEASPPPTYMPSDTAVRTSDSTAPTGEAVPPQTPSPVTVPPPQPAPTASTSPPPPALSFHEIAALQTPAERIQAYKAARHHYAGRDTGLAMWVARMRDSSLISTAATTARSSGDTPTRPLHSSLSPLDTSGPPGSHPAANTTPTSQQPYYQQYLHFSDAHHASSSSVSSRPAGASPSTAGPPGPAEGTASPNTTSGGKLSRDQVQAKGKDLLHSAGVLGGRANVAAKGFFSKGKSRWRTSGGGGSGGGGSGGGGGGGGAEH